MVAQSRAQPQPDALTAMHDEFFALTKILNVPLLSEEWAVRRVLRYGPDAVVEGPESVRGSVRARLEVLATVAILPSPHQAP